MALNCCYKWLHVGARGRCKMAEEKTKSHSQLLRGVLYISEETANCIKKLFCCCLNTDSNRSFLWGLFLQNASVTIGYFLLYLAFGMCIGFMGPTLEDLACYTKEEVNTISWLFFAQTCCMVVGVFLGGVISKWVSSDFLLLICTACLPATLLVVSLSRSTVLLAVMMAIMGLAMGMIDCLANLQLIHIYDKAVAPFLQTMHFCYGIGALISPLLARNFLLTEDCSMLVRNVTLATSDPSMDLNRTVAALDAASEKTKVYAAFWVIAAIQVPIVMYMAVVLVKMGLRIKTVKPEFKRLINSESKPILQELNGKEKSKAEKNKLLTQWQKYINEFQGSYSISLCNALLLTIAACLMVFIYDGLQGHINEFTETYAIKTVKSKDKLYLTEFLNVSFWAAYSLGRLISILLAVKLTPYFMLLLSIIGCQTATFMFLSCVGGQSMPTLIAANVMLGISMSSITPTTITMTEHFMDMTSLQMSLIIGGAALGEMIIPVIEGQLIDDHHVSFVTMLILMVGFSWLVYAVFWLMGRLTQKYKAMSSPSFIWYSSPHMDGTESPSDEGLVLSAHNYSSGTARSKPADADDAQDGAQQLNMYDMDLRERDSDEKTELDER